MKRAVCEMKVTVTVELPTPWCGMDLTKEQVIDVAMGAVSQSYEIQAPFNRIEEDEDGRVTAQKSVWIKAWAEVIDDDVESHLGMVSGYYYLGDKKKALKYCESAKKKTTDQMYLSYIDMSYNVCSLVFS